MLYGVQINGVDTLNYYGLIICADLKISQPRLKTNRVNIPGGDGTLNMSYSPQGYPVYEDREISFTLFKAMDETERSEILADIRNAYHGVEVNLVLPNDYCHYWHGVISVGDTSGYNTGKIPVKMTAQPYKLRREKTAVSKKITDSGTVTLRNERKPATPLITVSDSMTLAWSGHSVSLSAGTHTVPQLLLQQGDTEITVTGSGIITFEYQEGSL